MRLATALLVLALAGLCFGNALANPQNAVDPKPWHPVFENVRAIVPEDESVNNQCPGQAINCGDEVNPAELNPSGDHDWVSFYVANAGDVITMATDDPNPPNNPYTDTYLELYDACGGVMLAGDDDSGPNWYSLLVYTAPHAGTYYLMVRGYADSATGPYKLDVSCQGGTPPPPDDTCDGATSIADCTSGTISGDLSPYTNNYDPGSGGCASGYPEQGKDQAFRMNLTAGDVVSMVYTQTNNDAAFYVVTDCSNVPGTCVIGADAGYNVETINWTVGATGTYYLILDCYGLNTGGTYTLTYDIRCPGATGACCVNYVCTITTQADCQGTYYGDGTVCDPTPCPPPVPVKDENWGAIKANYR